MVTQDNCITLQHQTIEDAVNDLLEQNKVFYQREVEQLSEFHNRYKHRQNRLK